MTTPTAGAPVEERLSPENDESVRAMYATAAELRAELRRVAALLDKLGEAIDGEGGLAASMASEFAETRSLMRLLCPAAERRQPDPFAERCGPPPPGDEGLVVGAGIPRRLRRRPAAGRAAGEMVR